MTPKGAARRFLSRGILGGSAGLERCYTGDIHLVTLPGLDST